LVSTFAYWGVLGLVILVGSGMHRTASRQIRRQQDRESGARNAAVAAAAIDRAGAGAQGLQQLPTIGMVMETLREVAEKGPVRFL
jgi:hypothetical protein